MTTPRCFQLGARGGPPAVLCFGRSEDATQASLRDSRVCLDMPRVGSSLLEKQSSHRGASTAPVPRFTSQIWTSVLLVPWTSEARNLGQAPVHRSSLRARPPWARRKKPPTTSGGCLCPRRAAGVGLCVQAIGLNPAASASQCLGRSGAARAAPSSPPGRAPA